jgi:hypothetical protein
LVGAWLAPTRAMDLELNIVAAVALDRYRHKQ